MKKKTSKCAPTYEFLWKSDWMGVLDWTLPVQPENYQTHSNWKRKSLGWKYNDLISSPHITVLILLMFALNYLNLENNWLSQLWRYWIISTLKLLDYLNLENTRLSQLWKIIDYLNLENTGLSQHWKNWIISTLKIMN